MTKKNPTHKPKVKPDRRSVAQSLKRCNVFGEGPHRNRHPETPRVQLRQHTERPMARAGITVTEPARTP